MGVPKAVFGLCIRFHAKTFPILIYAISYISMFKPTRPTSYLFGGNGFVGFKHVSWLVLTGWPLSFLDGSHQSH